MCDEFATLHVDVASTAVLPQINE